MKSIEDKKLLGNSKTSIYISAQLPQLQIEMNTTDKLSQVLTLSSLKDADESATNSQTNGEGIAFLIKIRLIKLKLL